MGRPKTTRMKKNAHTSKVTNKDTKITKRGRKKKSDVEVEFGQKTSRRNNSYFNRAGSLFRSDQFQRVAGMEMA